MTDIIKVLPDSVANQIAAGEVIQRPASALKELLENSVDASATEIIAVIKDSGKTLIQIYDNGHGMSETDARLCFERHATSKISEADDLYKIKTMGFRGEALASIASIAHVELKTRKKTDELGTKIIVEGSEVKSQEACQCEVGTSFSIKNLFYNVPARRNFLKSDATELSYIIEEFQRVALVNPHISMSLFHNGKQIFKLEPGNPKQRIISIFSLSFAQKIVPVEVKTDHVSISGYIGKPEFARKTRGEQYFFANNRFIKYPYLHHAVTDAYNELIPEKSYVPYFIFIEVSANTIDINIHPTKTEVKFENERNIYMILRSAVKQSLGKFSLIPSLDFDIEKSLDFTDENTDQPVKIPSVKINSNFNPFEKNHKNTNKVNQPANWEKLFKTDEKDFTIGQVTTPPDVEKILESDLDNETHTSGKGKFYQLNARYIVTQIKSGLIIIHQQLAQERILFEKIFASLENQTPGSQQQLFPQTISLSPADSEIMREIKDEILIAGFDIEDAGHYSFIVNGIPADLKDPDVQGLIERVIDNFKRNLIGFKDNKNKNIAISLARQMAIKPGKILTEEEMRSITDRLFACEVPDISPTGKKTFTVILYEELEKKFE